jgi:hypothetical protein
MAGPAILWQDSNPTLQRVPWPLIARVCVAVSVAWGLLALYRDSGLAHPNVARGKPATSSSRAFGTEPSGAVDGNRYGQLGFHSAEEDGPWLVIDLERRTRLDRISVFGRADCCFEQSLPLVVEASDDGVSFRTIAERAAPFSQYQPWVLRPRTPPIGRFLRLRTKRRSFLVVSEVEVRGEDAAKVIAQ